MNQAETINKKKTIPEGYKMTKLGWIPEEWSIEKIGDIAKVQYGKSQKDVESKDGTYPVLGTGGEFSRSNKYLYDKESVLIGRKGTIDKPQYMDSPFWTVDTLFYLEILERCYPKWLYYMFCIVSWKKYNEASGVPSLNASTISNITIPLPPIPEQQKIAHILSTWDRAIEKTRQLIAKKQERKKGLMQQLLTGKVRFKEFVGKGQDGGSEGLTDDTVEQGGHGNSSAPSPNPRKSAIQTKGGYQKTKLGWIPGDWEKVQLKDITSKISDGIHATPKYVTNSDYFFINGNNLINYSIKVTPETKCVSKTEYYAYQKDLNGNTILLSINGTIGNIAFYRNENVILGKSVAYINCKKCVVRNYIFYVLQTHAVLSYFENELTGSTIRNLSLKSIKDTIITLPRYEEQQKIANTLSAADKEIEILRQQLEKLKEQKKGLMQKLLPGEVRVKTDKQTTT